MPVDVEVPTAILLAGPMSLLIPSGQAHRLEALDSQTLQDLALDQLLTRLESGRKVYNFTVGRSLPKPVE